MTATLSTFRSGITIAVACFYAFCMLTADAVSLPAPTPFYYTIVNAGFGLLNFSMHYEEYGDTAAQYTLTVSRYWSPSVVEWTDFQHQRYLVQSPDPVHGGTTCKGYQMSAAQNSRLLQGSTALLVNLSSNSVTFNNLGLTNPTLRSQQSVHYQAALTWSSSSIPSTYSPVDTYLKQVFATAGVSTTTSYSVSVTIDVYYTSDSFGTLVVIGGGNVPLRYTVSGQLVDVTGTSHPINIVYDFMQFSALDHYTSQNILNSEPTTRACTFQGSGVSPPGIPAFSLRPINTTLPVFAEGRAMIEILATNGANTQSPLQYQALMRPSHGQDMVIFLSDASTYSWDSIIYDYGFADQRSLQFSNGGVFVLNGSDADHYYNWNDEQQYSFCTGSNMNPSNISPLQWLNAGLLDTMFSDEATFFGKAVSSSVRQTIRGISTDVWTLPKVASYNGVFYNFTITVYVTSNGWGNLGRLNASLSPQLIRLYYSGQATTARGTSQPYTLTIDFFEQFAQTFNPFAQLFDPNQWGCNRISSDSILPPLPSQFSVSVNEAWIDTYTSSQYTVYIDQAKSRQRIDGKFTAPNTFSLVSKFPFNDNYKTFQQWTQNVTLNAGFSVLSVNGNIPYTQFTESEEEIACSGVAIKTSDYVTFNSLSFFDLLFAADPSQAFYMQTSNVGMRGQDVDEYLLNWSYYDPVTQTYTQIEYHLYYMSQDVTTAHNILVGAQLYFRFSNKPYWELITVRYQFFNFRESVPAGMFNSPAAAVCSVGTPILPIPSTNTNWFYYDPYPYYDHTPIHAPKWPAAFSVMFEGQIFLSSGDQNIYIVRWYADFNNSRERIDIEPAFNIPPVAGVTPITKSYLYYYNKQPGNAISFNSGIYVGYTGGSCAPTTIKSSNMNPLKLVAPGNLFDTFFPATTAPLSAQSSYNSYPRYAGFQFAGMYYDEYDWNVNVTYAGNSYLLSSSIYVTIPEWVNNPQAVNYSTTRIPLSIQATGNIVAKNGQIVSAYNPQFSFTNYVPGNPGPAFFDAALLGCPTTPDSPWYNIYGLNNENIPSTDSSSSSVSTSTVVGAVVGVVGGLLVLVAVFAGYRWWKRSAQNRNTGSNQSDKYTGGTKSRGGHDAELVGVGKVASDDDRENSLNRASLNNLVKEGAVEIEEDQTAAPDNTTKVTIHE